MFSDLPEWASLREAAKTLGYAPSMLFPDIVAPPDEPQPHGYFRSPKDLPELTEAEEAMAEPIWAAVFELVRQHPRGCGCDERVMAWRAVYAAIVALRQKEGDNEEPVPQGRVHPPE